MKKKFKYIILIILLLIGSLTLYKKIYIPKHTFKTIKGIKGNINLKVNGIGNIDSKNIYKIGSLYGGKIINFNVEEGQFIKKGTLIGNIDSVDLIDKIKEQKSLKFKLLNDINSLKIDRQIAKINFYYQNELFNKNKKLYKLHSISSLDYQKYLIEKNISKLRIQSVDSNIISLKNQILQEIAIISGLEKKLKHYVIKSPVDGYIIKKVAVNYQIIMQNQTLIELVNPKDILIQTYIDTRISGKVKIGDSASIKLRSSDKTYRGKVININPMNNSITYEREIDIAFDNLPIPFYMEEQAIIKIEIKTLKNIIKIPIKVLSFYKEKKGVWILKGNKVNFQPLKIIAYENKIVAVQGLNIDENIVIPDINKKVLVDGMKIYHD